MIIGPHAIELHVEQRGAGVPAFVFLHYWGGSSRTWRFVVEALAPEFRTVAIDQRGWGRSDASATGYALADMADDAQAVIDPQALESVIADSLAGAEAAKQAWPLATSQEDIAAAVTEIDVPAIVISGEDDRVDPPEVLRRELLPLIPQAQFFVLPKIGHLSPLEAPGDVANLIRNFASSIGKKGFSLPSAR